VAEAFLVLQVDAGHGAQDAVDVGVFELLELVGADEVRRAADVARAFAEPTMVTVLELGGGSRRSWYRRPVSASSGLGESGAAEQGDAVPEAGRAHGDSLEGEKGVLQAHKIKRMRTIRNTVLRISGRTAATY
jgi:hypothetical protein